MYQCAIWDFSWLLRNSSSSLDTGQIRWFILETEPLLTVKVSILIATLVRELVSRLMRRMLADLSVYPLHLLSRWCCRIRVGHCDWTRLALLRRRPYWFTLRNFVGVFRTALLLSINLYFAMPIKQSFKRHSLKYSFRKGRSDFIISFVQHCWDSHAAPWPRALAQIPRILFRTSSDIRWPRASTLHLMMCVISEYASL